MKNKVLLINPKAFNPHTYPYVGLFYIASILQKNNYDVQIYDCNFQEFDIFKIMIKEKPSIVGISCLFSSFGEAIKIADFVKENIGATTVLGGNYVSFMREKVLQNSSIDFAIIEEGEYSLLQLINAIENNGPFDNIPGLCFRRNENAIVNENHYISNLDELPFPNYRLGGINRIFIYPLITSRGCPYSCIYCSQSRHSNKKWRSRSCENIIDEIRFAQSHYSSKVFYIMDDNFSLDLNRAKDFCIKMIEKKVNIDWCTLGSLRVDKTDKELFLLMRKAGCKAVRFGIGSADERVFKYLKKPEALDDIKKAISWAQEEKIKVSGFFIIGLPYATFESEKKSLEFSRKFKLDMTNYYVAYPSYGTELYNWATSHAFLLRESINKPTVLTFDIEPFFETKYFSKEQIKKAFIVCNLRTKNYFINRGIKANLQGFAKIIKLSLKYDAAYMPFHIFNLLKFFFLKIYVKFANSFLKVFKKTA